MNCYGVVVWFTITLMWLCNQTNFILEDTAAANKKVSIEIKVVNIKYNNTQFKITTSYTFLRNI